MDRRESEAMDSHIVGDQDQYLLGGEKEFAEKPEFKGDSASDVMAAARAFSARVREISEAVSDSIGDALFPVLKYGPDPRPLIVHNIAPEGFPMTHFSMSKDGHVTQNLPIPEEPKCSCGPHPWSCDGPALDAVAPLPLRSQCPVHGDFTHSWTGVTDASESVLKEEERQPEVGNTTTVYGRWMSMYNRQIVRGEPRVGSGLHQRKVIRHTPTYKTDGTVSMDVQYAIEMRTF